MIYRITMIIIITGATLLSGCKSKSDQASAREIRDLMTEHPEIAMHLNNCLSCHRPDLDIEERVAPPLVGVQKHYLDFTENKEAFMEEMLDFMLHPSAEKSKMPGAVERFGLMPAQPISEKDMKLLAEYLYHADLEEPDWFKSHYAAAHPEQALSPKERGIFYAQSTKSVLGSNLLQAIKRNGPEGAVAFCNTRAIPLTDSMSLYHKVSIQRVSDKPRNPMNKATPKENQLIRGFSDQVSAGKPPVPVIQEDKGATTFYSPIVTNDMCLQCHGDPEKNISPATLTAIQSLYQDDLATGYKANQVRGMWKISWENLPEN